MLYNLSNEMWKALFRAFFHFVSLQQRFFPCMDLKSMAGNLLIIDNLDTDYPLVRESLREYEEYSLLITDGIIMDFSELPDGAKIQRILTVYQLIRSIVDGPNTPYIILARSDIVNSWPYQDLDNLYDSMRMKTFYSGCDIIFMVVGGRLIFRNMLHGEVYGEEYAQY